MSIFILFYGFDNNEVRLLSLVTIPAWIFLIIDSAMPNKFFVSDDEFGIKHSLFWRKWKWDDIDSMKFVQKKWLGFSSSILVITTKHGQHIELEETRFIHKTIDSPGQQKIIKLEKIFSHKTNKNKQIAAS